MNDKIERWDRWDTRLPNLKDQQRAIDLFHKSGAETKSDFVRGRILGESFKVITVDKGRDSVDIRLANLLEAGDIVVTQDFGVAALALGKRAKAMNQNGMVYDDRNMDQLLFERHLGQKIRRAGGRTAGAKKRTRSDDESFERAFIDILEKNI